MCSQIGGGVARSRPRQSANRVRRYMASALEDSGRRQELGKHQAGRNRRFRCVLRSEVESLAVDPGNPQIVYAGTWHLPWKTQDGGKNWENIKQGVIDDSDVFSDRRWSRSQSTPAIRKSCTPVHGICPGRLRTAARTGKTSSRA